MTKTLTIDTTSRFCSLAVWHGEQLITEYNFTATDNLSATLIPAIDFILNNLDLKISDINLFGITIGPGLFTGIRVGLSTLKGLLFSSGTPVVPVVTLEAVAGQFRYQEKPVVPLIDARREEVYLAVYQFDQDSCRQLVQPKLIKIKDLPKEIPPGDYCFTGDGAQNHHELVIQNFPKAEFRLNSSYLASEVGLITRTRFSRGEYISELQDLVPFYIRKPDAQVNLERSKQGT